MDKHVLSDETLDRLDELVKRGIFSSMDEAVQAALDLYDESRRKEVISQLRNEIRIGLESGPSAPFDVEAFLSDLETNPSAPD